MSTLEILKGKEPGEGDADLQLQLSDVREVARDGTARLGKYMVDTVEVLAIEALSCWEGFMQFCRDAAEVEPMVLMQGWGLIDEDPAAEIARLYPGARPDAVQAEAWRENLASCWAGRLDIIDANDQHMR